MMEGRIDDKYVLRPPAAARCPIPPSGLSPPSHPLTDVFAFYRFIGLALAVFASIGIGM